MRELSLATLIGRPDQASLYLSTERQIETLRADVEPLNVKGTFVDWRFITLQVHSPEFQETATYLLGTRGIHRCTLTSRIKAIDFAKGYVRTENSVYALDMEARGAGDPPVLHLANICQTFWGWGFGIALGIPIVEVYAPSLEEVK